MDPMQSILKMADQLAPAGSDEHYAVSVLLASLHVGPDVEQIAAMTGIERGRLDRFRSNLERNGVWCNGQVDCSEWFHEEHGYVSLMMDAMVAIGELERSDKPAPPLGTQPRPHLDAMPINPYVRPHA
jgi:hypothetical protein